MHRGLILWIYLASLLTLASGQATTTCCTELVEPQLCVEACERVSHGSDTEQQLHQLSHVAQVCPRHLISFWQCINDTFAAVSSAEQWSGRTCCELPLSAQCKNSCKRAKSRDALGHRCRSDEQAFFNCIDRQEVSGQCCGMSTSSRCTAVCRAIFIQDSPPTSTQRRLVAEMCDHPVAACVHNFTSAVPSRSPIESLPCCNHSSSAECRSRCGDALRTLTSEEEIVEEVSRSCGAPVFTEPLWQCFLRSSTNNVRDPYNHGGNIEVIGIDGAKLQCCRKAVTSNCRELCRQTYSRVWMSNVNFHEQCSYHRHELELNMCLEEVAEPCELGCSGLEFCTNFNYRPTEMFRSCTADADRQAESSMRIWSEGTISLPQLMYDIPVRDLRQCQPEVWKSIACTLQIKPCHQNIRATWICKFDCLRLLTTCLDVTRLARGISAESICNTLSPHDASLPCISLSKYLVPSPVQAIHTQVTNPCTPNPCKENEICMLNRRQCKPGHSCRPYICKLGCPMGEVLTHIVPHNSYVRLPMVASRQLNCYRVCKCGPHNLLHKCNVMACVPESHCMLGGGMDQDHDTKFAWGCNTCVCHGGNVVCTERECSPSTPAHMFTGLPCNCASSYVPVCGYKGRTYPNACIARCLGLTDSQFEFGRCGAKDPCISNPCAVGERCVARNQVCLNSQAIDCRQYECIRLSEACPRHQHSPVCDADHQEVPSMCLLLNNNRQLAHRGHCMDGCERTGVVCGTNGETYGSECVAWADGVLLDYMGPCVAVGVLATVRAKEPKCYNVECPPLTRWPHCGLITPPGACCGTCAGEIRVLYSRSQADRASHVTNNGPITVHDVRQVLEQQISVRECNAFVYMSIEGDLVILIAPIVHKATALQVEACMVETGKIGSLINTHSPTLMSRIAMAPFLSADVRTSKVVPMARGTANSISPSSCSFLALTLLCAMLHLFTHVRWGQC